MKKIITLTTAILLAGISYGQVKNSTIQPFLSETRTVLDTVRGEQTRTCSATVLPAHKQLQLACQILRTYNSGPASGTVRLLGSVDGVSYTQLGSVFTLADVSNNAPILSWIPYPAPNPYHYYKVETTGGSPEVILATQFYCQWK